MGKTWLKPSTIIVVALDYLDPQVGEISHRTHYLSRHFTPSNCSPWLVDPHATSEEQLGASTQPCHMALSESDVCFFTGNSEIWGQNIRNKNGLMSIHWDHVVGYPEVIQRTHDDVMLWEAVLMILCAWCMTITHDGMIMTMAMWGEYEHETETWSP